MAGVRVGHAVVDAHQIHRPAADVHSQQGRLVYHQIGFCQHSGIPLRKQPHILDGDAVLGVLVAEHHRLGRTKQVGSEFLLVPAKAGQRQARRDGDAALRRGAAGLQLLRDGGQRQQVVAVGLGLVFLQRLAARAAEIKIPAELQQVPAGVRFLAAIRGDTGWERKIPGLDGVVAVVDANVHGDSSLSWFRVLGGLSTPGGSLFFSSSR